MYAFRAGESGEQAPEGEREGGSPLWSFEGVAPGPASQQARRKKAKSGAPKQALVRPMKGPAMR